MGDWVKFLPLPYSVTLTHIHTSTLLLIHPTTYEAEGRRDSSRAPTTPPMKPNRCPSQDTPG